MQKRACEMNVLNTKCLEIDADGRQSLNSKTTNTFRLNFLRLAAPRRVRRKKVRMWIFQRFSTFASGCVDCKTTRWQLDYPHPKADKTETKSLLFSLANCQLIWRFFSFFVATVATASETAVSRRLPNSDLTHFAIEQKTNSIIRARRKKYFSLI